MLAFCTNFQKCHFASTLSVINKMKHQINPFNFSQVRAVRRDSGAKIDIANANLVEEIKKLLDNIQQNLFDVAKQKRDECIQVIHTWDEFIEALNQKKMILAPWADEKVWVVYFYTITIIMF
jgi:prolyl-tRNA synthetase